MYFHHEKYYRKSIKSFARHFAARQALYISPSIFPPWRAWQAHWHFPVS
jgi:hypothetical protein